MNKPNDPDRPRFVRSEPVIDPPIEVLQRYNARVLDPTTAVRLRDQQPAHATVYIADRLIVSRTADAKVVAALREAAQTLGLALKGLPDDPPPPPGAPPAVAPMRAFDVATTVAAREIIDPDTVPVRAALVPSSDRPTPAPDAWAVLQAFRSALGNDDPLQAQVGLDHLMSSARATHGSPFDPGGPSAETVTYGPGEYGLPGFGARMPVSWTGPVPVRRPDDDRHRRPVVAVLDTGIGDHPWFACGVDLEPGVLGVPIADPELTGVTEYPLLGWLDADAGHGTFIAGIIRQHCPDADIVAVRIMGGDGFVPQSALVDTLHMLVQRQRLALANQRSGDLIDILSLSLGYYHEFPDDPGFDHFVLDPLLALAETGVAIVIAAGNDSTERPMFPAAFAIPAGAQVAEPVSWVPLVSVGALNPNGTIALFSNAGSWVTCHRHGASVVSTFPRTFNGSKQASDQVYDPSSPHGGVRATIDPDDFRGGFGVWSGTSFAAPVLAGELAAVLCAQDLSGFDPGVARERAWSALRGCVLELRK